MTGNLVLPFLMFVEIPTITVYVNDAVNFTVPVKETQRRIWGTILVNKKMCKDGISHHALLTSLHIPC